MRGINFIMIWLGGVFTGLSLHEYWEIALYAFLGAAALVVATAVYTLKKQQAQAQKEHEQLENRKIAGGVLCREQWEELQKEKGEN